MDRRGNMENQQLKKSEVLRSGITNLLQSLPFMSVEEENITLAFIRDYGLKLPSYFTLTDDESSSMREGGSIGREKVVEEITNASVTTFRSVIGE